MKVLKGEIKALDVMLNSMSFFMKLLKRSTTRTHSCLSGPPHPAMKYTYTFEAISFAIDMVNND